MVVAAAQYLWPRHPWAQTAQDPRERGVEELTTEFPEVRTIGMLPSSYEGGVSSVICMLPVPACFGRKRTLWDCQECYNGNSISMSPPDVVVDIADRHVQRVVIVLSRCH